MKYVLGLAFSKNFSHVALIRKKTTAYGNVTRLMALAAK